MPPKACSWRVATDKHSADESKIGTDWRESELDAIVADYFAMLEADLSGRPYVKLRHGQALMAQIGRTHRSVEFNHQNISAVPDELNLPWIPGYKPQRNAGERLSEWRIYRVHLFAKARRVFTSAA